MTIAVPTLSTSGWVKDIGQKAEALLSYFLVSDANQSVVAWGRVHSMPKLLQNYQDPSTLSAEVRQAVYAMFKNHFDAVDVSVLINAIMDAGQETGESEMKITITVTENGKRYSVGRLLTLTNNRIKKVINT